MGGLKDCVSSWCSLLGVTVLASRGMTLTAVRLLAGKLLHRCPVDDPGARLERLGGALKYARGIQGPPVVDLNSPVNRVEDPERRHSAF